MLIYNELQRRHYKRSEGPNPSKCNPTLILLFPLSTVNFYSKTWFYTFNKPELDEKRIFTKS
jgi:hypothetical protein